MGSLVIQILLSVCPSGTRELNSSINQSINPPINEPKNQSIVKIINQSNYQLINQANNQIIRGFLKEFVDFQNLIIEFCLNFLSSIDLPRGHVRSRSVY